MLAPIVLFVYNRLEHTKETLKYLSQNALSKDSELYIFSDGAKNERSQEQVEAVRELIDEFASKDYFKKVTVYKSDVNKGLAKSIISGVSQIINIYGRVIVIEDDVIVSDDFLDYMNRGLEFYENNKNVFCIGGFSCPMKYPDDYYYEVFAMERTSSYTWASWKDRWDIIDWDIKDYRHFKYNFFDRRSFNRCGDDRTLILDEQMTGRCDSWAIRFEYNMFKNKMYSILPRYSRAKNIGHDGSGTHGSSDRFNTQIERLDHPIEFAADIEPDERIRKEYRKRFSIPFYKRAYKFLRYSFLKRDSKLLK